MLCARLPSGNTSAIAPLHPILSTAYNLGTQLEKVGLFFGVLLCNDSIFTCAHVRAEATAMLPAERKLLQPAPGALTVTQTAQGNPDLSTLVQALTKTGLAGDAWLEPL